MNSIDYECFSFYPIDRLLLDDTLKMAATRCKDLKSVKIETRGERLTNIPCTEGLLSLLEVQGRNLTSIKIFANFKKWGIDDNFCKNLAKYAINLKKLDLCTCRYVTNEGVKFICGQKLVTGCLKLEYIDLTFTDVTLQGKLICEQHLPCLKVLKVEAKTRYEL